MDYHYALHAISQQPRNWSTSDSNWSMQALCSQTSTSWYLHTRPTSRAAQVWAKSDEEANPTFIDSGSMLDIALRRGGGLVQWLIRCTNSTLVMLMLLPPAY